LQRARGDARPRSQSQQAPRRTFPRLKEQAASPSTLHTAEGLRRRIAPPKSFYHLSHPRLRKSAYIAKPCAALCTHRPLKKAQKFSRIVTPSQAFLGSIFSAEIAVFPQLQTGIAGFSILKQHAALDPSGGSARRQKPPESLASFISRFQYLHEHFVEGIKDLFTRAHHAHLTHSDPSHLQERFSVLLRCFRMLGAPAHQKR